MTRHSQQSIEAGFAIRIHPDERAAPGLVRGFVARAQRLLAFLTEEWRYSRAEAQLHSLDDWQLQDIGLTRDEIHHVVRHGRD